MSDGTASGAPGRRRLPQTRGPMARGLGLRAGVLTAAATATALVLTSCTSGHGSTSGASTATQPATPNPTTPTTPTTPSSPTSQPPAPASAATTTPPTSSATPAHPAAVWPTYHHDAARSGTAPSAPTLTGLRVTARATLDGALYASPLVLQDARGPLIIAATENDTVYGLRQDGSIVWSRHLGTPVDGHTLPCGNINPTGITGTPVYDPSSGLVFAVAFVSGYTHQLAAIDAETGALKWTRPVDPPGSHPNVEQQRAALLLADDAVWVAYGGLAGDCGPYHGYVVGVPTSGATGASGAPVIYEVPSSREAGIWTPAGPAADADGHIYVSVGNGAQTDPTAPYDMSDSVIELSPAGKVLSFFAPSTWARENSSDLDLGTTGPVLLPGGKVFVAGKAGHAYLLDQGALGGLGGTVPSISLCTAFGGAAYANGVVMVPCTNGVRAVRVDGTSLTPLWHASPPGSPVIGGGAVLSLDGSTLYALDPASGAVKAKADVGDATTRFTTPAIGADGHVYVGTQHGDLVVLATS
jgi:outer membrane protein assembly factor BamB